MSDLLAEHGYLVSGHVSFAEKLGLPTNVLAVLRHFHLIDPPLSEIIFLTLEYPHAANCPDFSKVKSSLTFLSIKNLFPNIRLLIFPRDSSGCELDNSDIHDSQQLHNWFGSIDRRYIENTGGVKQVNRSSNDKFADWTRAKLTRKCVVNDIDALLLPNAGNPGVLIELKRPKQDIHKWCPYRKDRSNYITSERIANDARLKNRTLAYNLSKRNEVALHVEVKWNPNDSTMDSKYCILSPEVAISSPLKIKKDILIISKCNN